MAWEVKENILHKHAYPSIVEVKKYIFEIYPLHEIRW